MGHIRDVLVEAWTFFPCSGFTVLGSKLIVEYLSMKRWAFQYLGGEMRNIRDVPVEFRTLFPCSE